MEPPAPGNQHALAFDIIRTARQIKRTGSVREQRLNIHLAYPASWTPSKIVGMEGMIWMRRWVRRQI